jgi:hypothetical protein
MLKLFNGPNVFTKMYVSKPANLHIFYVEICRGVENISQWLAVE